MIYLVLKTVHVLSIIVWIRGMVFTHFFLHPAATRLAASDGSSGGAALVQVRRWAALNLGLGLVVLLVTLLR